jgi:hypothetical protein
MIIGPLSDSRIAPGEPSTHSTDIPLVIDLSAVTEVHETTSPFADIGAGNAHAVSESAIRNIPICFIGNPHRSLLRLSLLTYPSHQFQQMDISWQPDKHRMLAYVNDRYGVRARSFVVTS